MKITKKGIVALLMCIVMLVGFCSCNSSKNYFYKTGSSEYVYKYGDYSIDKNFYNYWVSRYKAVLMYTYYDIEDTDKFWDAEYGEGTANEVLTGYADETIKNYLMSVYLFDKFGLEVPEATQKAVDTQLQEILDDGFDGNVASLNEEAYKFGINYNMLKAIYLAEAKTELVYDYLNNNVLKALLDDEIRQDYLKDNYAHTTHIFVATEYSYNVDKDGNVVYDENGGYTTKLTDEEKAQKKALIEEIDALTLTADNFAEYQNKYNDDVAVNLYKNGYFVSSDISFDTAYVSAALTMEVGEIKKVEGTNGVYYIFKQEMPQKAYEDETNKDFFDKYDESVLNYLYWEYMEALYVDIEVNREIKESINVKNVSPCWYM